MQEIKNDKKINNKKDNNEKDNIGKDNNVEAQLRKYSSYLREQEKSCHTIEKYCRDVRKFLNFAGNSWDKNTIISYKGKLQTEYKVSSANSMIAAVNSYLYFIGKKELCIRAFKVQKQIFCDENREMTLNDYRKLINVADKNGDERLLAILQTIASTGIRVSELSYITVESLLLGEVTIECKGKQRVILMPESLIKYLEAYCRKQKITKGIIFITRSGQPVLRQNLWAKMKTLCEEAGVLKSKVYPHNLRHLFAKMFYEKDHDLVRLADYLGHSSVETTRRYTIISSREACRKELELGLVVEGN